MRGAVSLLALLGVALSGNAHAATGGLLGATSTGTANISVTKSVQAQISDLSDMTLPNWSVGDGRRDAEKQRLRLFLDRQL